MELRREGGIWRNKSGAIVDIEPDYIYPLMKSNDLKGGRYAERGVIIPQQTVGADTTHLRENAPKLWGYLNAHAAAFERRKSSIYRNKPPFSIFGIGDYSFKPYKLAISGFYTPPRFVPLAPIEGKPVMLDDTGYLLAFDAPLPLCIAAAVLNHAETLRLLNGLIFPDAKRPIKKTILDRLNIPHLLQQLDPAAISHSAAVYYMDICGQTITLPDTTAALLDSFLARS
jgi:hypothetical protein